MSPRSSALASLRRLFRAPAARERSVLRNFEPDVESLLVNRVGPKRDCYRAGVDHCYALVGLIRTHWRGLSGGAAVWEEIGRFFAGLKERAGHA